MPRHKEGQDSKFQEYRDLPESVIVPQLQLMIGGKKEDFFLEFDSSKLGLDDQNYRLRVGRYGLLDMEFEWDQIPHLFSHNVARTPFARDGGGGTYTLPSKPASTTGTAVRDWVNANAAPLDLKLLQGIGRFKLRYTPTPNWSFTGNYWSQNVTGKRAFGALFGPSPGSYNITELAEPLDYQTHNIELGGEYAGNGWSLGLKYNGSLFHNNVSTLVWDNPLNPGIGGACTEEATYNGAAGTGPCRGRFDLYPSNHAHSITLSGTAALPLKSRFLGTVSYGWRFQNDPFLPFTINGAISAPTLTRRNLDGDVRPLMVNATVVNHFIDRVDLKAYYRLYDLDNRSKKVDLPTGYVANDSSVVSGEFKSFPYAYSKQNIGFDAGYRFARWASLKVGYVWENMHRERREVLDSNEHIFGPTLDITPASWLLLRMSYRRQIRDAHDYDAGRQVVLHPGETPEALREELLEDLRKFDEAARNRDKFSVFTQISVLPNLTLHGGFEFVNDRFPRSVVGVKDDVNYSPSVGFVYAPIDWLSIFGDYNWERFDWKMRAMERSAVTQDPANSPGRLWTSRGRDQIHTFSLGSDVKLIKELLGLRLQYTFSDARSFVRASGNPVGTAATNYPALTNRWHEFLARFEYDIHKNLGLRFGYYYNRFNGKDFGVDIMKPWMGDVDTGANVQRSIFLGDKVKSPYTAHIGFLGLRVKF
ncbi:MAG TPA: MtrB/PioB family decaheme-associated outer membrane protein [candidate division Zixibacteria bacterium]|nr:MtrB/PioB family decaheme-associated outer membrane protein [candidate division Zixibacteria bacterium]